MKALVMTFVVFLVASVAAGCIVQQRQPHSGVECVVPMGHVHDDDCGHYHFGGRWYYIGDHRHSPTCGHVYVEGTWTVGH